MVTIQKVQRKISRSAAIGCIDMLQFNIIYSFLRKFPYLWYFMIIF